MESPYNIMIVAQNGGLECQAILFIESFLLTNQAAADHIHVCTPVNSPLWETNPDIRGTAAGDYISHLGARILPFENPKFGSKYPHSNKVYALSAMPEGKPFVFFDTDNLIVDGLDKADLDFAKPQTRAGQGTWPKPKGPFALKDVWDAVYRRFDLETEGWYRPQFAETDPRHYPYFQASVFYHKCPQELFKVYAPFMESLYDDRPAELKAQHIFPWLDQITLPAVLNHFGADNSIFNDDYPLAAVSHHYHTLPRLFLPRNRPALNLAQKIVSKPETVDIFNKSDSHRFYFSDEGYTRIQLLARRKNYLGKAQEFKADMKAADLWHRDTHKIPAAETMRIKPRAKGELDYIVCGMPRSGTTAVSRYLNASGITVCTPECFGVRRDHTDIQTPEAFFDAENYNQRRELPAVIETVRQNQKTVLMYGNKIPGYTMRLEGVLSEIRGYKAIYCHRDITSCARSYTSRAEDTKDRWPDGRSGVFAVFDQLVAAQALASVDLARCRVFILPHSALLNDWRATMDTCIEFLTDGRFEASYSPARLAEIHARKDQLAKRKKAGVREDFERAFETFQIARITEILSSDAPYHLPDRQAKLAEHFAGDMRQPEGIARRFRKFLEAHSTPEAVEFFVKRWRPLYMNSIKQNAA